MFISLVAKMVNTLQISKQLQEAGIQSREADAIAQQMANLIESDLASKQNLKETELTLQSDLRETELRLQGGLRETELSLQKDIEEVRLSLQKNIEEVRLSLQKEIEKSRANTILWVAGLLFAQAALVVTLLKLL